ncbi:MAG TPA: sigma-70 family RNA polymerase sigma factor [Solirubrobacteraceae bacterium]|nr:sigma-70 family RNA polymerase sigma factor [Solirubrobacteraceae bacterium]
MKSPGRLAEPWGQTQIASTPRAARVAPRRLLRLRSDAVLGERFAAGDESAFAVLYERHRPSVLAISIAVLGSRHDAEDAAQEAFAALAVALRRQPPRELRPWLVRVTRNAAIDLARRRRGGPLVQEDLDRPGPAGTPINAELASVLAGIRELPLAQRTALLMRELAGHSYREIATMMDSDEDAVKGLIARARIGLRNYREASELPCSSVRATLAAEADGRRRDKTVRRHMRGCPSCQAYREALRTDAQALRALAPPVPTAGLAGGGAAVGLVAKGALAGGALSQVGAVCAASICSVGGFVLLAPQPFHRLIRGSAAAVHATSHHAARGGRGGAGRGSAAGVASTSTGADGAGSWTAGSASLAGLAVRRTVRGAVEPAATLRFAYETSRRRGGAGTRVRPPRPSGHGGSSAGPAAGRGDGAGPPATGGWNGNGGNGVGGGGRGSGSGGHDGSGGRVWHGGDQSAGGRSGDGGAGGSRGSAGGSGGSGRGSAGDGSGGWHGSDGASGAGRWGDGRGSTGDGSAATATDDTTAPGDRGGPGHESHGSVSGSGAGDGSVTPAGAPAGDAGSSAGGAASRSRGTAGV